MGFLLDNSFKGEILVISSSLHSNILCDYPIGPLPIKILWNKSQEDNKTVYGAKFTNLSNLDIEAINKILVEYGKKKFIFKKIIKRNINDIFSLLKDFQNFPNFMRDVKNIRVIGDEKNKLITEWNIQIDGVPLFWKEKDVIDEEKKIIKFKMLEGDYGNYEGEWRLEKIDEEKTNLKLLAEIDWGLPTFEKFIGNTLKAKARKSLRSMVNSIKKEIEKNNG